MKPKIEQDKKRKEKVKQIAEEQMFFILSSSILIEALKGDKAKVERLLKKGGPIVKRRVLDAVNHLKNWIEAH